MKPCNFPARKEARRIAVDNRTADDYPRTAKYIHQHYSPAARTIRTKKVRASKKGGAA